MPSPPNAQQLRPKRCNRACPPAGPRAGLDRVSPLTFIVPMPRILDVEAALLLLELEPPFDQRTVQLARRRMAKQWHPDIAPPGRRYEHQQHLQAINQAADELERLAEASRGG